jgi:sugar/nucleoside kinase (ribokinase family)
LDYLRSAAHFHLSSLFLLRGLRPFLPKLFFEMKQSGLSTSLDTNDDPENLWAHDVHDVLKSVDVFLPNEQEACKVAGVRDVESALNALSRVVPLVVIKCGAQGVVAKNRSARFSVPALSIEPVDTVGAGDSFNAGFLHKFVRGCAIQECLEYGVACAGLSTTRAGGTEAFREQEHRVSFLAASPKR